MRYRSTVMHDIPQLNIYLFGAIGDGLPVRPKWELHSVVPFDNKFLVILQTTDEVLSLQETADRGKAAEKDLHMEIKS